MENGVGSNAGIDKSKVLEVKPLRCLVPVFPNPPGMSSVTTPHPTPFVCVSPAGPFPAGVQPFYPFLAKNDAPQAAPAPQAGNFGFGSSIPAPVPLNSFRTPTPKSNGRGRPRKYNKSSGLGSAAGGEDDGFSESQSGFHPDDGDTSGKRRGRPKKTGRREASGEENHEDVVHETVVNAILTSFKLHGIEELRRNIGDVETSTVVLRAFDALRRRLTQLDELKDTAPGTAKRPDLKAANLLMTKGIRANAMKRIGHVPGIEIGDIFFFRMELCIVGLHAPSMAGIDYMSVKVTMDEEPLAVSIVSSGGYDDNGDDSDILIYSGQGGVQRRDGQMFDQKLERGNLALEKSLHRGNDVRVVRGIKDLAHGTGKIYVYDGLYKIQESWIEKNKSGCTVFKYKLVRIPGQPEAFSLWKSIQQWKDGTTARAGIIIPDLTSGAESLPVALVNDVDNEKGPAHFTYVRHLRYLQPFSVPDASVGCHCLNGCQAGDTHCPCNQKNDGFLPYSSIGVLLSSKSVIHECAQSCSCPITCRNRISQVGIRLRLEVFKTKSRGWGLRSWDPIRAGGFICEYAGDIIKPTDAGFANESDEYIFDSTRNFEPIEPVQDSNGAEKSPFPLIISAKDNGNVSRFMNHSCSPNVYWQPVLRQSNNDVFLHIAFFAIQHIPPMQELVYDYGIVPPEKGRKAKKKCLCGSSKCRGFFH
ncbi:histone-lysine N-methyltransferase, H3 lysine-9 specific SUVH1-like [Andrographis paniculata]|uniref:histone-lysine N-methyltransferase, H3 lysine-9 specific SUVH1-like n=1 Tax=Andrographis paniculata TaxID=175694 RepID=UPI0021E88A61|nr:histone-lysine N-methyltransferase, H3 lysine-9 specific SUVH1-like [Andrographis paniculata]XP_051141599.1 histone-lysine N-methyltransferase, H3 lysine-9 specific SUVH1-like [Andrographis paniculata]